MLKRFFQNTYWPDGFGGRVMAALMNSGHASVASWGFLHFSPAADGKWVKMLDGMTIYKKEPLIELLKTAGFASVPPR